MKTAAENAKKLGNKRETDTVPPSNLTEWEMWDIVARAHATVVVRLIIKMRDATSAANLGSYKKCVGVKLGSQKPVASFPGLHPFEF